MDKEDVKTGKQKRLEKKAERAKTKQAKQSNPSAGEEPVIEAFSQVSRFHTETLETLSTDVDLKGVCINVGDKPLLEDSPLRLFKGVKYGLIGRNGVGKSTLLKSIGHKLLVGFPTNIRVLYVEQLEGYDQDQSVVDVVKSSDTRGNLLRSQAKLLERGINLAQLDKMTKAIRYVKLQDCKARESEAREIANRRSGARGAAARRVLNEMEELTAQAEAKFNLDDYEASADVEIQTMLDDINDQLRVSDAETLDANTRRCLSGLGFTTEMQDGPLKKLSGGWKIRASLASALLIQPDILLLDEPTNHLDLPAILWLQSYLQKLDDVTVVIVSHDRAFLNATTTETIVLKDRTLKYYTGNYDEYLENFTERQEHLKQLNDTIEKKRETAIKTAEKNMIEARRSGDSKKMQQSASKQRKAEEMGMDHNNSGFKFKRSRDMPGFHSNSRLQVELESVDAQPTWTIPNPEPVRNAIDLAQLEQVSFKYPGAKTPILSNVTLNIPQGARIGIVGANGQGKSTLVKLITNELLPQSGSIQTNNSATVAYFSQQHIDDYFNQNESATAVKLVLEKFGGSEQQARKCLGSFGVKGDLAVQPLKSLSGGQMVRVAFAMELAFKPAHFLVLDEPTNHLDFGTIEALTEAIQKYKGAVLIVSHDQHFIQQSTSRVYMVGNSKLTELPGGIDEYVKKLAKASKPNRKKKGAE